MLRPSTALLLGSSLALGGCLGMDTDIGESEQPVVLDIVGEPAEVGEKPQGIYMVIPPEYASPSAEDEVSTEVKAAANYIIYMNKDGGTFTPGVNNSSTNRSSVPNQTSQIPPWNVSDADWQAVMSCVRDQFAPFNVEITDEDPGDIPHVESVVAGSPGDLGLPNGVGGVSPFTNDCSVIDRSIVYTFAEVFQGNTRVVCEVVAQEVAHSFGLDHEYLCEDPMTYLGGCGQKTFQDIDADCGENAVRDCACADTLGPQQNSYQMLSQRLGTGDGVAPDLAITAPTDGATVTPGFSVEVDASDDSALARVELLIDGTLTDTLEAPPFTFSAPADLATGTHVVETRAYDDSDNEATDSISVTIDDNLDPEDPNDPNDPDDPNTGDPASPGDERPADLVGTCSATGSGPTGGVALVLLAGLLVALRRRRLD